MTLVRPATMGDLKAIEALRRADGDALGFLPAAKYEALIDRRIVNGRRRFEYENVYVTEDNGDVTGFCLAGFHRDGLKIEQICVRNDARRRERASLILGKVEMEADRRGSKRALCRVAADIEANLFWLDSGFVKIGTIESTYLNNSPSKSARRLIVYRKALRQMDLPLLMSPT